MTVSSTAGTTTFTCTVSGSPASPATPAISGQPIIAATSVGGAVSSTAQVYSGPITLTQGEQINARVLSGSTWSALNASTFYVNLSSIRVTELMYDPLPATAAEIAAGYKSVDGQEDFEFIELQNIGATTLPLGGLTFTNGVSFTFPAVSLAAGAYIVACSDPAAFAIRYGSSILQSEYGSSWLTEAGYSGHFNNGGEEVTLSAPSGGVLQDFTYSNSWYPQTAGGGFSLVARSATQALSLWNSSSGWEASGTPGGTPGGPETVAIPLPDSIVVNEAMSNTSAAPGDMIEFYNTTSQPINIGGWFVSDSSSNLMKYQIASGTIIAANGYYVLTQDYNFGVLATDPGCLVPFGLNASGDDVYLTNNYAGQPGGYREHQTIPAMPPGYSYGLYTKSDGTTNFTLLQSPSFGTLTGATYSGAANSIPYVSPLVTDEIMYNPTQPTTAEVAAGYTDSDFEYVELYNRSSSPVSLGDYYVAGGIGYTPGWLADGLPGEFETLESGATATWSPTSSLASASYTIYAHLNLYDGDNNPLSDLDSSAQYTVNFDGNSIPVLVDQDQVPATLSVTSLTYDNSSGLVTANANNSLINNNSLVAGSIVHISGATPSQYDGTFVVQNATSTSFTYALASGLNLAAGAPGTPGPGTITAGLNDVWINLGTYSMSGTVSVQLARTTDAKPSEWTVAGGMELVASQGTTVLGAPAFSSYSIQHPTTTLAPGQYAVLVSNYAAFEERYNPTGNNNILVLGVYSGHLSNGGDTVDIYQLGNLASGSVAASDGYVPFYRVDHVSYNNAAPWPLQPDGNGQALIRIHTADYGNDAVNWEASNLGGTPGQANLVIDTLPPTVPTNLAGQALLSPTAEVSLAWSASSDPRSDVDHYVIYRNGSAIGTSTTTSFADTTISAGTNYTYAVTAVNRDGYASAQSTAIVAGLPAVTSYVWLDSQDVEIYFSEPLTSATATVLGNYSMTGGFAFSAVALSRDGTLVTLTTKTAVASGNAYTITMTGLATISGDKLPASLLLSVTYQNPMGTILDQVWDGLDSGDSVSDLTSPALNPNYPNNPTYVTYLTSFNAPYNTGVSDYGQRVQGYIYPPTTGQYVFWIASDDNSQLWLSTNSNPANIGSSPIAYNNSWTSYEEWTEYASQQSAPITLVAGQHYYIEALMKQGGGGDNLSVAWMLLPSGGTQVPSASSSVPSATVSLPTPGAISVTQITRSGTTATATFSSAPGFVVGQNVTISGATQSAYNGTFAITAVSGTTIKFTVSGSPTTPATGTITATPVGISASGKTAYVWYPNNGYAAGTSITIAGATPATFDGTYSITTVVNSKLFEYTMSATPSPLTASGTITVQQCGITYSGSTATVNLPNNGYTVGQWVNISGASPAVYDGAFQVTAATTNTFSYTVSGTLSTAGSSPVTVQTVPISYSGTTATVWLPNNGYAVGDWINITGASPTTYDGLYEITAVTTNTFTYTMSSTPTTTATGTILANLVTLAETVIPGADLSPLIVGNVDPTAPAAPANLQGAVTGSNNQITLTWNPVLEPTSGIDHYAIYRDGALYATSTTTSYTDTSGISSQTRHSYQVAAVNYDGVQGTLSPAVSLSPVGIASITTPTTTSMLVAFSEAVDPASAQLAGNYQVTTENETVTSAVLESDGRTVLLTLSAALDTSTHTLTVSNVETLALTPLSSTSLTANFTYTSLGWSVTVYEANIGLNNTIAMAQTLVSTPSEQSWVKTEVAPYIDYNVTGGVLHFTSKERTLPGTTMNTETDNFAVTATGTLVIPAAGTYTFGCDSDDGFSLTIAGATFSSVTNATNSSGTNSLQYDGGRGVADTLGVVAFSNAGSYPVSLLWFQGNGGAACELYAGLGSYTSFSSTMELVGDTADGGLGMVSGYVAPPFSVGVNTLSTNNTSPALTGTVTDPAASVTVRVNGIYYPATNNGVGGWSLPQGEISPLGAGNYNVAVIGTNAAGTLAFDSTVNELTVGTGTPTVSVQSVAPQTAPISSLSITFSEPVFGFSVQSLQLTLNASSLPLEAATLSTTDNQHWTLGNLSGLTGTAGTYNLTVTAAGWGITDAFGDPLMNNAATSWTRAYPLVQSINTSGSTITNASSVQYAVSFNESVTNVVPADFTLATNGAAGTIASVSGSGSTYTVTVNNVSGNGTLGLNVVDDNSVVDQNNNPLGGPALGDGNFTGPLYTIDTTAPTISIGLPSTVYAASGPVTYTVTYADTNFNSSTLAMGNITLNETGTANGTLSVSGSGLTPHGHHQRHHGRRLPGDFDRHRDRLRPGRQPGPGRRAQRDLHGGQHGPHGGHTGQCRTQPRHRYDNRSFGAGGGRRHR